MGNWQVINLNTAGQFVPDAIVYDDGDTKLPSDTGFSLSSIIAYAAGRLFNFMGTPNWRPA